MKTLNKILLTSTFLLTGLSLSAQDKYFSKNENQKYYVSHSAVDMNEDSIPDVILAKYDINQDKKIDTYAMFLITKKDSVFHTSDKAMAISIDKDEDGVEDVYYIDTNLDGILDKFGIIKKEIII